MIDLTSTYHMPVAAFVQAVEIANNAGRNGRKVSITWIPPSTASDSPIGHFAVQDITPRTASEAW